MGPLTDPPPLSERTRRAVQDYTALNTITTALEHRSPLALDLLALLQQYDGEHVRVPLDCPLGRRMLAVGLLRRTSRGTRGAMRRKI